MLNLKTCPFMEDPYYFLTQGNYFTVLIYGFKLNSIKKDVTFVLSDNMCHLIVLSIF